MRKINMIDIIIILGVISIVLLLAGGLYESYIIKYHCKEYEIQCFRWEGSAGLFSSMSKIQTPCEFNNYDTKEEICIRT